MNETKREEIAANRLQLIYPLIDEGLDKALINQTRKIISEQSGVSVRTLERYFVAYQQSGFEGLKPKNSEQKPGRLPKDFDKTLSRAIELRREVPERSVSTIIRILELEGVVKSGMLKRSTLQDHLAKAGMSAKQMRTFKKTGLASRRFQKTHRCQLYQGDIKYGPYFPFGPKGERVQVYLSVIIDDATRFVVAARFYDNLKTEIVEDTLRRAVTTYGIPDAIYFDNGKQYRNEHIANICHKLGIHLLYAKPYSPEAKGKVEAFNRTVNSFISEAVIDKPDSLEALNQLFEIWLDKHYHQKPHSALECMSPLLRFRTDTRELRFASAETVRDAFRYLEKRFVDKTGCLSIRGKKYDVGMEYYGKTVEVLYDPNYPEEVEVRYEGYEPKMASILQIGEWNNNHSQLIQPEKKPDSSRLLRGLQKQADRNSSPKPSVLNFSSYLPED